MPIVNRMAMWWGTEIDGNFWHCQSIVTCVLWSAPKLIKSRTKHPCAVPVEAPTAVCRYFGSSCLTPPSMSSGIIQVSCLCILNSSISPFPAPSLCHWQRRLRRMRDMCVCIRIIYRLTKTVQLTQYCVSATLQERCYSPVWNDMFILLSPSRRVRICIVLYS